jgi:hypothetical protein
MPEQCKTPGTQVNIGTKGDIFVLTEGQRHELMRINREVLTSTNPTVGQHNASDLQLADALSGQPAASGG